MKLLWGLIPLLLAVGCYGQTLTTRGVFTPVNITARDVGSSTTTGANGQSIISGTPTAGSYAVYNIGNYAGIRVEAKGTWTGTLQAECTLDSATWFTVPLFQDPLTSSVTYTANFSGVGNVNGCAKFRIRSTAAMTGTATINAGINLYVGAKNGTGGGAALTNIGTGAELYTSGNIRSILGSGGVNCIENTNEVECFVDSAIVPIYSTGSGAPAANCTAGRELYLDTASVRFYRCSATNTWTQIATFLSGSGAPVSGTCDAAAEVGTLYYRTDNTSSASPLYACGQTGSGTYSWVVAGGSGGSFADPGGNGMVARTALNTSVNRTITGTANEISVSNGDGVAGHPTVSIPSTVDLGSKTTLTHQRGTSLPGTCTVGSSYQKTDATAASQWYLCTSTNTWTVQGAAGSGAPRQMLISATGGLALTSLQTTYHVLVGLSTSYSSEVNRRFKAGMAGDVKDLCVTISSTQNAAGSLVANFRINGAGSALTLTIAAGSTANTYCTTTESATIAKNDYIAMELVNNYAGNSAAITAISVAVY